MLRGGRLGGRWAGALLALALGAAGCGEILPRAGETKPRPAVVAGRVAEPGGAPVEGVPVRVVALRERVSGAAPPPALPGETLIEAATDADGSFRLEFERRGEGRFYYLDFGGKGHFDDVRFLRPAPVDLTERLRESPLYLHDSVLSPHPLWPQVEALVGKYEAGSHRARVLRRYGIPEGRTSEGGKGAPEVEIWWYYTKGKSFRFRDGVLERESEFRPVAR